MQSRPRNKFYDNETIAEILRHVPETRKDEVRDQITNPRVTRSLSGLVGFRRVTFHAVYKKEYFANKNEFWLQYHEDNGGYPYSFKEDDDYYYVQPYETKFYSPRRTNVTDLPPYIKSKVISAVPLLFYKVYGHFPKEVEKIIQDQNEAAERSIDYAKYEREQNYNVEEPTTKKEKTSPKKKRQPPRKKKQPPKNLKQTTKRKSNVIL